MKFRSTTGEPIHIGLTSGHSALIGIEPTELPKMFHKEAISRGALPEGVESDEPAKAIGFDRKQAILDALNAMVDGDTEGDFNADGRPSIRKLNERLGFTASREEVDAAWAIVSEPSKD